MNLLSSSYLTVAIVVLFTNTCYGADNQAGTSNQRQGQVLHPADQLHDHNILAMLEHRHSKEEFKKQMFKYANRRGLRFNRKDVNMMHNLYEVLKSFDQPCTHKRLITLNKAKHSFWKAFRSRQLKFVMELLLQDNPAERYVMKCFADFKLLAETLFNQDQNAPRIYSKLMLALSPETKVDVSYNFFKADMNTKRRDNIILNKVLADEFDYDVVCEKTKRNKELSEFLEMMSMIIGPEALVLRTEGVVDEVRRQISDTEGPLNATKLMCLTLFCNSLRN